MQMEENHKRPLFGEAVIGLTDVYNLLMHRSIIQTKKKKS